MKVINLYQKKDVLIEKIGVAKIIVLGFFSLIFIGSVLLYMPFFHTGAIKINYIDALFIATSATCVTGLTTIPIDLAFNRYGEVIIMILIELGGLGLMTVVSLILLFVKGKLQFKERMLLKDSVNKDNFQDLKKYVKNIIKYSLSIQFIGSLILSISLIKKYGILIGYFKSLFLSISAFNNAGFDTLGSQSLVPMRNDIIFNITIVFLIILGGLGYVVLFDIRHFISKHTKKLKVYTKLTLLITAFLIFYGLIMVFILEYNNQLTGESLINKILLSLYTSTSLRTAGFYSIFYDKILNPTKIQMIILMFIGGSPGGTAGGIKTTTIFLVLISFIAQAKKDNNLTIFNREISTDNFLKAFGIFTFYLFIIFNSSFLLSLIEKNIPLIDLVFETVSAISTTGLSINVSPLLSFYGKIIVIILMFVGRVGPITIAYSMTKEKNNSSKFRRPNVEVLVG